MRQAEPHAEPHAWQRFEMNCYMHAVWLDTVRMRPFDVHLQGPR